MQRWLPLIFAAPLTFAFSCQQPQCAGDGDCEEGQFCQNGSCFDPFQVGNRGDAGPFIGPGAGDDGGPPNNAVDVIDDELLTTTEPRVIKWLLADPQAPGRAAFSEYEAGSFDVLRSFTIDDGIFAPDQNLADNLDPCNVDTASQFTVPAQGGVRTELWLHCSVAPTIRVIYDRDFLLEYKDDPQLNTLSAQITHKTDGNNGNFARLLFSSRGGSRLRALQLTPGDVEFQPRIEDTFAPGLTFSNIMSLHRAEESAGNLGDHVLVFDAGANRLVPIVLNGEVWEAHPSLQPLELNSGARAVHLMGAVNANNVADDPNAPNVAVVYPGEGRVRFYNFETGAEIDVGGVVFEPNLTIAPLPPTSTRVLLGATPSGDAIHYTHELLYRTYRIPLRPVDSDVRMFEANPIERRISGLVVAGENEVWLTYGTDPQGPIIERVRVDQLP